MGIRIGIGGLKIGSSGVAPWTPQKILTTFGDKIALWTSKDDEKVGYYVNKIGVQEREAITENGVAGIVHPGRAISYDGAKSQYSATNGNMPVNFRLNTNSITISGKIKESASPAANTLVAGCVLDGSNGEYAIQLTSNGFLMASIRHSSVILKYSTNVCDGIEHTFFMVVDKTGNFAFCVDNVLQRGLTDISTFTFNALAKPFYIGGGPGLFSGIKYLRDIRIWSSAITSDDDRLKIHNGEYIAGCTSWWFCEEGKENSVQPIKDSIGSNHLINYAFDGTSLVSGAWPSLLNKFGYSISPYIGDILIDGAFSDNLLWTYNTFRWTLNNSTASWVALNDTEPYNRLMCNRLVGYSTTDILTVSFDIVSGTGTITFHNGSSAINDQATYVTGHHDIEFSPLVDGVNFGLLAVGTAFIMDNLTVRVSETGIIVPKMDAVIPTTDIHDRILTFKDQAKYNLQKVSESVINLPDYIGELFTDTELISVNDWYDANGIGNEIALVDIEYQSLRQYYNALNEELIIIKSDVVLTAAEDNILERYTKGTDAYAPLYNVYKAKGLTTGSSADIYKSKAWIDGTPFYDVVPYTPPTVVLNPANKYVAFGWADFFTPEDPQIMFSLGTKYGVTQTFYRQIAPNSNDYKNESLKYDRNELKMIEHNGSYDANHSFLHISFLASLGLYDGRLVPSANDLRVGRADGTNELGSDINATVDTSITSVIRKTWMRLSDALGAKAWKDLTDADCLAFTKSLGIFGMPLDGQNGQLVLETLDILSARYCGTTGYSVLGGDYATRTPNTSGGVEPDNAHRILGGIFQGSSTTFNHEIWERVLIIEESYKNEFDGKTKPHKHWSTPGGTDVTLAYWPVNAAVNSARYIDKNYSYLMCGVNELISSITGIGRSFFDCLRNAGYKSAWGFQGSGYGYYVADTLPTPEISRVFKKNSAYNKIDDIGIINDYIYQWQNLLTEADIDNALSTSDVAKYIYDLTATDARFIGKTTGDTFTYINTIVKKIAWGITPLCLSDSGSNGILEMRSSMAMGQELLMQFCLRAGIKIVAIEEAHDISRMDYSPANYFPNPSFETTPLTILASANAPTYPDGWNGGVVISEDTGGGAVNVLHYASAGTIFTRQYAIKPLTLNLTIKAKGVGTLNIRKILNSDTYSNTSLVGAVVGAIAVNSPASYTTYTVAVPLPDAPLETYSAPATPAEAAYQNYMKGYGDKICGIQIELIVAGANYVKMGNCSLLE